MRFDFGVELGGAFVGIVFLLMFFQAVQARWPENYYSISDITSYRISVSPVRYVMFRLGPILLISILVAIYVQELGGRSLFAVGILALVHAMVSSGNALFSAIRGERHSFARTTRIAAYIIVILGIFFAAFAGFLVSRIAELRSLIPDVGSISETLWTALFAGVIGAFLVRVSQGKQPSSEELLKRSKASLDPKLMDTVKLEARAAGVDARLAQAILLVENLQRPSWIRRLERIKGRAFNQGSYGVMQVQAERPLTDIESVEIAVRTRLPRRHALEESADTGPDIGPVLRAYNPDPNFTQLAETFYYQLPETNSHQSDAYAEGLDESDSTGELNELGMVLAISPRGLKIGGASIVAATFAFIGSRILWRGWNNTK